MTNDNYVVTSPEDPNYNCVAWSYDGSQVRRMWPGEIDYFWPEGVPGDETPEAFVALFQRLGFELCVSGDLEPGFRKLVIYIDDEGPCHVAHQLDSGRWASKLGDWEDIEHDTPQTLEGSRYGKAAIFLRTSVASE
jgi:hypothetical protein